MAASLVPGCQVMSDLLTIREKSVLVSLLDPQCKLIKTTVAQLLEAKESLIWSRFDCGVVCLVEDESVKSYFLRLYCVKRAKLMWEQEIFVPFKYTATRKYFHTFPADNHQAGLNFANEMEAEEFYQSVTAVHEMMTSMTDWTNTKTFDSYKNDPGNEPVKNYIPMDPPSAPPTTSSFKDLDPAMRRLLTQSKLTEEDLKDKDIAEAVDCIINKFGGLKAVERELRSRGSVSRTLPRSAGASISLALRKGPLPPLPSVNHSSSIKLKPRSIDPADHRSAGSWIPSPSHASTPTERIWKSASFKHVSSSAPGQDDLILTALKDVFRQKQTISSQDGSQLDPKAHKNMHL